MVFICSVILASTLALPAWGAVFVVSVGDGGSTYQPSLITARAGDLVQFQFMGGNHTVTKGDFDRPCQPFSARSEAFYSGFVPAASAIQSGGIAVYTLPINDSTPMIYYCSQARHCQNGMVGGINVAQARLNEYIAAAITAESGPVPDDDDGSAAGDGDGVVSTVSSTTRTTRQTTTSLSSPSGTVSDSTTKPDESEVAGMSPGAKAGIAIGVILGLLVLAGVVWLIIRQRRRRRTPTTIVGGGRMDWRSSREHAPFSDKSELDASISNTRTEMDAGMMGYYPQHEAQELDATPRAVEMGSPQSRRHTSILGPTWNSPSTAARQSSSPIAPSREEAVSEATELGVSSSRVSLSQLSSAGSSNDDPLSQLKQKQAKLRFEAENLRRLMTLEEEERKVQAEIQRLQG